MSSIDLSKYSQPLNDLKEKKVDVFSLQVLLSMEIKWFRKKFGSRNREAFYSELSLLLATGVDIKTAFEIIEEDVGHKDHRKMLENIKNGIISGKRIHDALELQQGVFSKYELESVRIGEETGKLSEVLKELGSFFRASIRLRRQIISVLTYPAVVISIAILIVYFMLVFVVPVFSEIFTQTGNKLPEITQLLIRISAKSGMIFNTLFLLILGALALHKTQSNKKWYRKTSSALLLKIPVVNSLIRKIYLARFCQSMKLLAGAKVMINEALELVGGMIGYYPIEQALHAVRHDVVAEGKLLNESLSIHNIFPKKLIAMIKLSEEINAPEIIFEKLYLQYTDEIDHQQQVVGKLIEPIFIVLLGVFVGFILVAMYLPMFELSSGTF